MATAGLEILNGRNSGRRIDLTGETTLFGRLPSCDLVFSEETVSRRHARIVRKADGFYLEDLDSRNGTYLNGRRVQELVRLTDRDQIYLYDIALVFSEKSDGTAGPEWPALGSATGEAPAGAMDSATLVDKKAPAPPGASATRRAPSGAGSSASGRRSHIGSTLHPSRRDRRFSETVAEIDIAAFADRQRHVNAAVKLDAMLQMTRNLQSSVELDEVLTRILEGLSRIFPQFQRMYILRVDAPAGELVTAAYKQRGDDGALTVPPIAQNVAREVLASGKAILSVDVFDDRRAEADRSVLETEHGSFMCSPLMGGARKPLGILYVETEESHRQFVPEDLDVLACVAVFAGHAVEQATLHSARYRAVVDTAVDGIITVNENAEVESANAAAERLLGYRPGDLIGRNIRKLLARTDTDGDGELTIQQLRTAASQAAECGHEVTARRKDGSRVPVRISIGEFELDGRTCFTAILHDITEQKQAEAALKQLNETLEDRVQTRTESLLLLQDIAVIANEAESILPAFQAALERMRSYLQWPAGRIFMRWSRHVETFFDTGIWSVDGSLSGGGPTDFEGDISFVPQGLLGRVVAEGDPAWIEDGAADETLLSNSPLRGAELKSALLFPVLMADKVVAVFVFFSTTAHKPDDVLLNVLSHAGTQLGRVVERHWLQKELIDAVWQQQHRFGRELHDTLGQQLSGLGMMADSLGRKLRDKRRPESDAVLELADMIQQAKLDARRLAKGLFPVDVDAQGLRSALDELARSTQSRSRIQCAVDCDPDIRVPDNAVATHLFRIAQEAVNNAVKHSGAEHIFISLTDDGSRIALRVRDDGTGISQRQADSSAGIGMRIMRYRAHAIGATLTVNPADDGGTVVNCTVGRWEPDDARK